MKYSLIKIFALIFFIGFSLPQNSIASCITDPIEDPELGLINYNITLSDSPKTLSVAILDQNKRQIKLFRGHPIKVESGPNKVLFSADNVFFVDLNDVEHSLDGFMEVQKIKDMKPYFLLFRYQPGAVERFTCWGPL